MSYAVTPDWRISAFAVSFDVSETGHPTPILKVTFAASRPVLNADGSEAVIPDTGAKIKKSFVYREFEFTSSDCSAFLSAYDPALYGMREVAGEDTLHLFDAAFKAPADAVARFMLATGRWVL